MADKLTYKQYQQMVEEQSQEILDVLAFAATGNMDVEIKIPEGIDVMTDLAIGFSYLIDDVKELLREQQRYQAELEKRVAERTAELEHALQELRTVQTRYVREQWDSYVPETAVDTAVSTDTFDDIWLPALADAVQTQQAVYKTTEQNGSTIALPIRYADTTIGVLGFAKEDAVPWEMDEITAVEDVIEQLGLALENQRLFDQSQQRAAELSILNEMVSELTQMLDVAPILEAIYRYTSRLMSTSNFYVALYNRAKDEISFPIATEEDKQVSWRSRPFGNGMSEYILKTGRSLFVDDGLENWLQQQGVASIGSQAQSWMGVPLRVGGETVGLIAVQSSQPHFYNRDQFDLLNAVANQASIAIQNAQQFQQEQTRAQRQQMLREIAAKVRGSADVDTIMRTAVHEIGQALGRQTFVYLGSETGGAAREDA